ncbi:MULTISPECIES: hypothetical protein [Pseudomonas syringae group]|uniref:Uncharacterized protein n=2 Tax=Pseudomonas syringae group TaxID=136849 RepID=A0A0P9NB52_PSESX|nr:MULTISPECIES: hypothetical protein [Pseudomonas syringae group]KPW95176.1 Uncharacterized protein ALO79_01748 [Pseudomonas syringae pv. castaneae]KWS94838.1 hypothetical protein AL048_22360 [Pseudomonas syringae pv. castaneae]RMS90145.1 hypothetical protein ALP58_00813 [Pseudomonas savastanoi]
MDKQTQTEFKISYDAPGDLENHQINAKDLGNAIIGMHDLITKAASIVSSGASEAELKVLAPAQEGSLEIVFAIVADPLTTITVMKAIGISVVGAVASAATAIGIIDRLKDTKIDRVVIDSKTKEATLITKDGEFNTTSNVAQLVSSREIRQALHKVIQAPLQGISNATISFISKDAEVVLAEPEIKNFTPIRSDVTEKENKEIFQKVVQFTKLNFKSRRGWTVQSKDGLDVSVTIRDDAFLSKVAANEEAFQKDKFYTVEIQKTETINISGAKTSYDIVRVISEHN